MIVVEKVPGDAVGAGRVVAEGIIRYGVPFIRVVLPVRPDGARETGISVELGTMIKGVPFMIVVEKAPGGAVGAGRVVAEGIIR